MDTAKQTIAFRDNPLVTPVLLIVFKRPDLLQQTFDEVRKAKPPQLFVAADGPRDDHPGDAELCRQTRDVIDQVDWDCEVFKNYQDQNLGCRLGVSSAIDWFFQHVEEGIILQDDCLPNQSFFWFCQELLERYRHDERVMAVSGSNPVAGRWTADASYYFSRLVHIIGFATWRRAWEHYDLEMKTFPEFAAKNRIANVFPDKKAQAFYMSRFSAVYTSSTTWDWQLLYAHVTQNGLCAVADTNLVSNIGLGVSDRDPDGHPNIPIFNIPTEEIEEISHPACIMPASESDDLVTSWGYKYEFKPYQSSGPRRWLASLTRWIVPPGWRPGVRRLVARLVYRG